MGLDECNKYNQYILHIMKLIFRAIKNININFSPLISEGKGLVTRTCFYEIT